MNHQLLRGSRRRGLWPAWRRRGRTLRPTRPRNAHGYRRWPIHERVDGRVTADPAVIAMGNHFGKRAGREHDRWRSRPLRFEAHDRKALALFGTRWAAMNRRT